MVAAPLGMLQTLSRAGRRGIAIMDGRTLEMLPLIDTVVFDKTGTLTSKVPALAGIVCAEGVSEADVLRWSAAAEHHQSHPVAQAIRTAAAGLVVPVPEDVDYVVSNGVQARVEGAVVLVGSARYMAAMGIGIPHNAQSVERLVEGQGHMAVHVARNGVHAAMITLRTTIRDEAYEVVEALRARGIRVRILSGDGFAQTAAVARELGISEFDAEVLPDEKSAVIAGLRDQGRHVCFVGDGINDVVAMREAHVSVAVAGTTEAATAVAGVIIYDNDLHHVTDLLEIGLLFRRRTVQSLAVSTLPAIPAMAMTMFMGVGMLTALTFFYGTIIAGSVAFLRPWPHRLRRRRTVQTSAKAIADMRRPRTIGQGDQLSPPG